MKTELIIILALFVALILFGCQATTTYYLGAKADEEGIFSLEPVRPGPQQWQDLYVTVDFDLQHSGDQLDIDGVLSFSDSPKINYTREPLAKVSTS